MHRRRGQHGGVHRSAPRYFLAPFVWTLLGINCRTPPGLARARTATDPGWSAWQAAESGGLAADMTAWRLCRACGNAEPVPCDDAVWPLNHVCPTCGHSVPTHENVPLYAAALADTSSGFPPSAFEHLAGIEAGHFWFVPRSVLLGELAKRHAPDARRILEVGCGTGFMLAELARRFPKVQLVGSELHTAGLKTARQRLGPQASFVQMDGRAIPAKDAFDLIGAFDVIEHIEEDEVALAAIHHALRPGGVAIIAVPQHPWLWSAADEVAHHARRYRRGELQAKLRRSGLEPVFSTSYCTLLLPLMIVSRVFARLSRQAGDTPRRSEAEARPGALLNAVLRGLLQAEVALVLAGLRLPIGGSRIVVARKTGRVG